METKSRNRFVVFCILFSIIGSTMTQSSPELKTSYSSFATWKLLELSSFLKSYEEIDFLDKKKNFIFDDVSAHFTKMSQAKMSQELINKQALENDLLESIPSLFGVKKRAKKVMRPLLEICEKYQVDPYWVVALTWTETHFNYNAKSRVGAKGLMQVMPVTRKYLLGKMKKKGIELEHLKTDSEVLAIAPNFKAEEVKELRALLENIEVGVFYIKRLMKQFDSTHYATVAYNMGPTWVRKSLRKNQEVGSDTNQYLNKVKKFHAKLLNVKSGGELASL